MSNKKDKKYWYLGCKDGVEYKWQMGHNYYYITNRPLVFYGTKEQAEQASVRLRITGERNKKILTTNYLLHPTDRSVYAWISEYRPHYDTPLAEVKHTYYRVFKSGRVNNKLSWEPDHYVNKSLIKKLNYLDDDYYSE